MLVLQARKSQLPLEHDAATSLSGDVLLAHMSDKVTCWCRTALQVYVLDVIHSLVEEQISPVLVRLATTGPQVGVTSWLHPIVIQGNTADLTERQPSWVTC